MKQVLFYSILMSPNNEHVFYVLSLKENIFKVFLNSANVEFSLKAEKKECF